MSGRVARRSIWWPSLRRVRAAQRAPRSVFSVPARALPVASARTWPKRPRSDGRKHQAGGGFACLPCAKAGGRHDIAAGAAMPTAIPRLGVCATKPVLAELLACRPFKFSPVSDTQLHVGSVDQRPGASRDQRPPSVLLAGSPHLVPRRDQSLRFAADRPEVWDRLRDQRDERSRISFGIMALERIDGGRGGIRTPDAREGMPHFECGAFNRSATLPRLPLVEKRAGT